jgi:hypothetical protein
VVDTASVPQVQRFLTEWMGFVTDAMSCFYAFCFLGAFLKIFEGLGQGVLLWSGDIGVVVVILMRVHSTHERESGGRVILRDRTPSTAAKD